MKFHEAFSLISLQKVANFLPLMFKLDLNLTKLRNKNL